MGGGSPQLDLLTLTVGTPSTVSTVCARCWGGAGPPSNRSWRVTRELLHVENHSPVTTPRGEPVTRELLHMKNHSPVNYSTWRTCYP